MAAVATEERQRLQNLDDAEQRRVEFPTDEEWKRADDALSKATLAVMNVSWKLQRIAEFRGVRTPTFEDIGRVHANSIDLRGGLDELDEWVRGVRASLKDLDYVRVLSNIPDNDPDDG